jgi:hypothetical protein
VSAERAASSRQPGRSASRPEPPVSEEEQRQRTMDAIVEQQLQKLNNTPRETAIILQENDIKASLTAARMSVARESVVRDIRAKPLQKPLALALASSPNAPLPSSARLNLPPSNSLTSPLPHVPALTNYARTSTFSKLSSRIVKALAAKSCKPTPTPSPPCVRHNSPSTLSPLAWTKRPSDRPRKDDRC